jgi:plastocyanin
MNKHRDLAALTCALLFSLTACDDTTDPPAQPTGIHLAMHAGDIQVAPANSTLPLPLSVVVTDDSGAPRPGVAVRWESLHEERPGGVQPGVLSSTNSITDMLGVARVTLTLGSNAGTYITSATVGARRINFTSIAQIQGATKIGPIHGHPGNQADTVFATLAAPYKVLVRDHLDRPVAGVVVRWYLTAGGGTLAGNESTSDANGIAAMTFTLGQSPGRTRVHASVDGLEGSPVRFDTDVRPGNPVRFAILEGDMQWGKVGSTLRRPYEAVALDSYGFRVSGIKVDWEIASGGGSVVVDQPLTQESGVHAWHKLGPAEGTQQVTATAVGMPGAPKLTFSATAVRELVRVATWSDWYYYYDIFGYVPQTVAVPAGTPVVWVWDCDYCRNRLMHNVTFEDDATQPTSSPSQSQGTHRRTFPTRGVYRYRCTIHSTSFTQGMIGTVIVE